MTNTTDMAKYQACLSAHTSIEVKVQYTIKAFIQLDGYINWVYTKNQTLQSSLKLFLSKLCMLLANF